MYFTSHHKTYKIDFKINSLVAGWESNIKILYFDKQMK